MDENIKSIVAWRSLTSMDINDFKYKTRKKCHRHLRYRYEQCREKRTKSIMNLSVMRRATKNIEIYNRLSQLTPNTDHTKHPAQDAGSCHATLAP